MSIESLPEDLKLYIRDQITDPADHISFCRSYNIEHNIDAYEYHFNLCNFGYQPRNYIFNCGVERYFLRINKYGTVFIDTGFYEYNEDDENVENDTITEDKFVDVTRNKNVYLDSWYMFEKFEKLLVQSKCVYTDTRLLVCVNPLMSNFIKKILSNTKTHIFLYSSILFDNNNSEYVTLCAKQYEKQSDFSSSANLIEHLHMINVLQLEKNTFPNLITLTIDYSDTFLDKTVLDIRNLPKLRVLNIYLKEIEGYYNTSPLKIIFNNVPNILLIHTNVVDLNINIDNSRSEMPVIRYRKNEIKREYHYWS